MMRKHPLMKIFDILFFYRAGEVSLNITIGRFVIGVVVVAIVIFLGVAIVYGQPEISGYYEHTYQAEYAEVSEENILDYSKFRLDFSAGGDEEELEFRGNVNFIQYHSDITYDIRPFLPNYVVNKLRANSIPTTMTLEQSRIFLDNAFLTWNRGDLRIRAGKQQLSWGTGYSFNPTDLFHKKTMVDPTYEKEGVTALRMDYRWGVGGQMSLIYSPGQKLEESGYALRLGTHISEIGYDIAFTAHNVSDSSSVSAINYMTRIQNREALGLEFSGALLGMGFWAEGNYNFMEREDDFLRVVSGLDYTTEGGVYLMAEVMYNGRGEEDSPYSVEGWLANMFYGEPVTAGWGLFGIRKDLTSLTIGSMNCFVSRDGTAILNPRVEYSLAQNADLVLFGMVGIGEGGGSFPTGYNMATVRANVYF